MNNLELLKEIDEKIENDIINEENEKSQRFLVFKISDKKYAFRAEQVREVMIDNIVYYLPFSPEYIRGLLNRHGEPYIVIDLLVMFEGDKQVASRYLIMNIDEDQISFLVSDVEEIINVNESEIHHIQSSEMTHFSGSFTLNGREIFIINIDYVIKKLEEEI